MRPSNATARAGTESAISTEIHPKRAESPLAFGARTLFLRFGRRAGERRPQRFEPFSKPAPQGSGQLAATIGVAIERRPPLDECPIATHDRRNPQSGPKINDRQRWRTAEFVGLRVLDVGLRQQPLPDLPPLIEHAPDGADGVTGFAVLDPALAGGAAPKPGSC